MSKPELHKVEGYSVIENKLEKLYKNQQLILDYIEECHVKINVVVKDVLLGD